MNLFNQALMKLAEGLNTPMPKDGVTNKIFKPNTPKNPISQPNLMPRSAEEAYKPTTPMNKLAQIGRDFKEHMDRMKNDPGYRESQDRKAAKDYKYNKYNEETQNIIQGRRKVENAKALVKEIDRQYKSPDNTAASRDRLSEARTRANAVAHMGYDFRDKQFVTNAPKNIQAVNDRLAAKDATPFHQAAYNTANAVVNPSGNSGRWQTSDKNRPYVPTESTRTRATTLVSNQNQRKFVESGPSAATKSNDLYDKAYTAYIDRPGATSTIGTLAGKAGKYVEPGRRGIGPAGIISTNVGDAARTVAESTVVGAGLHRATHAIKGVLQKGPSVIARPVRALHKAPGVVTAPIKNTVETGAHYGLVHNSTAFPVQSSAPSSAPPSVPARTATKIIGPSMVARPIVVDKTKKT